LPFIQVPLHTVIKLNQQVRDYESEVFPLGVDGVNTHVPRPL